MHIACAHLAAIFGPRFSDISPRHRPFPADADPGIAVPVEAIRDSSAQRSGPGGAKAAAVHAERVEHQQQELVGELEGSNLACASIGLTGQLRQHVGRGRGENIAVEHRLLAGEAC